MASVRTENVYKSRDLYEHRCMVAMFLVVERL